ADNACLWAHLPNFVERPILKRQGGAMTLTDIEVAARLQASVLRFVTSGAPDTTDIWPQFARGAECSAILDRPFRVAPINEGERVRFWDELAGDRGAPDQKVRTLEET